VAAVPLRREPAAMTVTREDIARQREVALVDLVDRLLAGGVVIGGDVTLSIADVDLVYVGLRALITSVATADEMGISLPPARGRPFQ
jgi:Gas vesicle protein